MVIKKCKFKKYPSIYFMNISPQNRSIDFFKIDTSLQYHG